MTTTADFLRQLNLRTEVAQWPLAHFDVHKFGAHGAIRRSASEGWCPSRPGQATASESWPCKHYGADLSAPEGTKVVAPKDGWLLYLGPADAKTPPFAGYGPGVALIAHADVSHGFVEFLRRAYRAAQTWRPWDFPEDTVSLRYSLIGHLKPRPGAPIDLPGDVWDSTLAKPHKAKSWTRLSDGVVAMMDEADGASVGRIVHAGDELGTVSSANHIHWEIRTEPLPARGRGRMDPISFMRAAYKLPLPDGANVYEWEPTSDSSGGGGGVFLLLAALAFGSKKKRGGSRRKGR